jgi:2-hydroxychromene-2-carboxylate isomerase
MLILHYDLVSAPSAVAVLRLQRIADAGGDVRFVGVDPLGLDATVPATLEQLEEYDRWRDDAARLGLTMRRPQQRPPTLRAHLVGDLAADLGLGGAWRWTALTAYWTRGADLGDPDVLEHLAAHCGVDPTAARDRLADPEQLRLARQRAVAMHRRGIGGAPVLEVDGTFVSAHLDEPALAELAQL